MQIHYQEILSFLDLDDRDIKEAFSSNAVQRGINYYKTNQVLELTSVDFDEGGRLTATGRVAGSYQKFYSTEVEIDFSVYGDGISSYCNCPVGMDCKHGVALLLSAGNFLYQQVLKRGSHKSKQENAEDELDVWLDAVQELEAESKRELSGQLTNVPAEQQPTFDLVYLLDYHQARYASETEGLCMKIVKARKLKKGGYGQVYAVSPYTFYDHYSGHVNNIYHTEQDNQILRYAEGFSKDGYGTEQRYYIQGDIGLILLKKMLESGRAFWQDQKSQSLSWGENRTLKLGWEEHKKAKTYQVKLNTDPNFDTLFFPDEELAIYLDLTRYELGEAISESLSFNQLQAFINAPAVPFAQAESFSEKLLSKFPEIDFPLPVETSIEERTISDTLPDIHLKLHAIDRGKLQHLDANTSSKIHIAGLSFHYDGIEIKPALPHELQVTNTVLVKDKCRYRIQRQLEQEALAFKRMAEFGFEQPTNPNFAASDLILATDNFDETLLRWDHFLEKGVSELEAEGWQVEISDDFSMAFETIDDWYADIEEGEDNDWFAMDMGFELNGETVNLLPLLVNLLARSADTTTLHEELQAKDYQLFQIKDAQYVKIPTKRILLILDTIIELYDKDVLNKDGQLEISQYGSLHLSELLNDPQLKWKGAKEIQALSQKIQNFSGIEDVELPTGLQAELRDYQKKGLNWLQFLRSYKLHGILADDMGLGKTLQVLSNLLIEKEAGRAQHPNLVIAPTSLMSNWRNEAAKFTPELSVLVLQGADRAENFPLIEKHDVILTTYPLMVRDQEIYQEQEFHYLVLDEAQAIKNAKAKTTQNIYQLKAQHRLCVTGTPMENNLGEIWSMYHFLMPGFLNTNERFNRLFRMPIEKHGDQTRGTQLQKRVSPFLLRRTKEVVAAELPEKTEMLRTVSLVGKQRDLYETVRVAMDKKVRDEVSKKGLARSHIMILDALLKLRQVCCDPQLVNLDKAKKVKDSAKFDLLMTLVPEMVEEGRKILIFSQFTKMLGLIEAALKKEKIIYSKLTGQTRKREEAISAFQEGDASVFLISLKAGGVGLNLTAADTVIHYDPWWNPAAEKQATDRAYRIGQDKPVFVYKLITEETVEEKILHMQGKKQALADSLYGQKGKQKGNNAIAREELMDLLKPLE